MNARLTIAIVGLTLLAACNPGAPAGNTAAPADTGPDPVEAQINNLSAPLKETTFFRAIRDANYDCQRIVNVVSRGRIDDKPVWAVECDRGAQFVIRLQRGGIFHVSGVPRPPARP